MRMNAMQRWRLHSGTSIVFLIFDLRVHGKSGTKISNENNLPSPKYMRGFLTLSSYSFHSGFVSPPLQLSPASTHSY
jgi:hypothetical protein